jgi:Icc-related predicted phosphoesterase
MIIDCISDLHGFYPTLEGGDLLIIAGDLTASDMYNELVKCDDWLRSQKYKYKKVIVIAGNHDSYLYDGFDNPFFLPFSDYEADSRDKIPFAEYLCDSGTEFEYAVQVSHPASTDYVSIDVLMYEHRKLKIWGSPWTLRFKGMNPNCMAFTVDTEEELAEKWALIPDDVDILVTHGPPFTILDITADGRQLGSTSLMSEHMRRLRPKLWVWGHIHEAYGQDGDYSWNYTNYVNASHVNERYEPVNKPIRIEL